MIKKELSYTTSDQQIEKLKSQGLIIEDEAFAKSELELYGYSNLIKSYRDPYTFFENDKVFFRSGVTFDQIHSLYIFDKNLRNAVMASMLDFEEHIKEAAADVIASSFGIRQEDYLNFRNYRNKKKRKKRFCLSEILKKMNDTLETDKMPVCHYQQKYATVPPWILFKSVYFGTIVNFISFFKQNELFKMVQKLYSPERNPNDLEDLSFLLLDTLFICLEYRNLAAHGGRVYNHKCQSKLRLASSEKSSVHGIKDLLFLLKLFDYKTPYEYLNSVLLRQLNRHCNIYPEDITYLGQILHINITQKEIVWVTSKSSKYHLDKHCSGIKDPIRIDLTDAQKLGLSPCKKCYSEPISSATGRPAYLRSGTNVS